MPANSCVKPKKKTCPTCGKNIKQERISLSSFEMVEGIHDIDHVKGFFRFFFVIYLFLPFFLPGIISHFVAERVTDQCCSNDDGKMNLFCYRG